MNTKQILELENGNLNTVILFSNGYFCTAYEHSAMRLAQASGLKATKRHIASAGADLVKVGFPVPSRSRRMEGFHLVSEDDGMAVYECSGNTLSEEDFLDWKSSVPFSVSEKTSKAKPSSGFDVEKAVLEFDSLNATPMDCFLFVNELKRKLSCPSAV